MSLTRRFTPVDMLFLSVNGIIGSAWLFAPLYAAKIAGSGAIISWLLGGAATILIALTFAEISSMLPISGGTPRFAELTHGATTGFFISWISWLSCVAVPPIEVQAVLQYSSAYIPSLTVTHNHLTALSSFGLCCACVMMVGLTLLNLMSFKGLIRSNFIIFSFKVLVIILTIIFLSHHQFNHANFALYSSTGTHLNWSEILSAIATGGVVFALMGFKHGFELAGEMTKPNIGIPLAIIGSVTACLALYIGLQIAFIGAVHPSLLLHGFKQLTFPGDLAPFVGIAGALGIVWLVKLLLIDAVISPLGAGLIYTTSTARIVHAMSDNHYLHPALKKLNKEDMPVYALWLNCAVGMFLFLPLPGWQNMVEFLVSAVVISYAMGPISLVCLRKQLPNQKRLFRIPCSTITAFFAFYCANLISFWTGWETLSKLSIALLIGGVVFISNNYFRSKNALIGLRALWWLLPYLAGLMILSYLGDYGGHHLIPFGWDFLAMGIFSLAIFIIAVLTRASTAQVEIEWKRLVEIGPMA